LRRSVRRGWTWLPRCSPWLPGVLLDSRVFLALRWMMLEKVLGVDAVRCQLYLAAKASHLEVDADGLSYPLHHPTICGC
jgi:hypothetical protein